VKILNLNSLKEIIFYLFIFVDRRDVKANINPHAQSRGIGVRTPVMTSGLIISTFLSVELRLMRQKERN